MDPEQESATVAQALAAQLLLHIGVPSRPALRDYIRRSESNRGHFDALNRIYEELDNLGKAIPGVLATWQQKAADGRRQRPPMKPVPPHRPANPNQFERDILIQLTIGLLERLRVPPYGTDVSGCRVVAEALGLSEDTVTRIWKECTWRTSFMPVMRKYSKAITERNGPFHTH